MEANFCSVEFTEARQQAANAAVAAARYHSGAEGATAPRAGSFLASREFKRLAAAVDAYGALLDSRNSMVEIGVDFGQPYHFKPHSTGMMFWR